MELQQHPRAAQAREDPHGRIDPVRRHLDAGNYVVIAVVMGCGMLLVLAVAFVGRHLMVCPAGARSSNPLVFTMMKVTLRCDKSWVGLVVMWDCRTWFRGTNRPVDALGSV